jgi:hypothetical protein
MATNRWIENSRKIYTALLSLYPTEHRNDYAIAMQQVFTDQCRSAYQKKGALGITLLWLRILPDLGYTALLEQVTSSRAGWGLMEPVPNAPLPWKGVFLILLPGLVYLVSQVAQLTGQPWYMTVYYRAAFFLIVPVLVVWAITRRFPLWGLIPVGLLYRLVQEIGYQLIVLHPQAFSSNPFLNLILTMARQVQQDLWFLVVPFTIAILFLAWRYVQKQKPSRSFWLWLGIYILIACATIVPDYISTMQYASESPSSYSSGVILDWFNYSFKWRVYDITAFLLLIFIGTLFTRRHGFFAILIPVGYILPIMLVGTPWNLVDAPNPVVTLTIISIAILTYRSLLSLVAPIWMSRTSSLAGKKRIVLTSIAIALGIHAVMQFYLTIFFPEQSYHITPMWVTSVALDELKLISAICLGIVMYQNTQPAIDAPGQAPIESPELSTERA